MTPHHTKALKFGIDLGDAAPDDRRGVTARTGTPVHDLEELLHVVEPEADALRALDEAKPVDQPFVVKAVAVRPTGRFRQEPAPLVVTQGVRSDTGAAGELGDRESHDATNRKPRTRLQGQGPLAPKELTERLGSEGCPRPSERLLVRHARGGQAVVMDTDEEGDGTALELDAHGRPEPPAASDETTMLLTYLDYHRATFAWKFRGLDSAGLNTRIATSTMTLGGMMKHLALVEDGWFSRSLFGHEYSRPWDNVDWEADPDWEWRTAAADSPDELRALWERAVVRSREMVAEALASGGLDRLAARRWSDGRSPSLRWIILHMIEEYARHNGHADLLREAVDGETGE